MLVRVLFFAAAREAAGCGSIEIELPEGSTVREAQRAIAERFPSLAPRLPHCRMALDREFTGIDAAIRDGAELAVIPPVSGG